MKKYVSRKQNGGIYASRLCKITASIAEFSDKSFEDMIEYLTEQSDYIWSYDNILDYAIEELKNYNIPFALWLIQSIYETDGEYYFWDSTAGSTAPMKPIANENDAIDVYETIFGND